jgi:hypothetical protein
MEPGARWRRTKRAGDAACADVRAYIQRLAPIPQAYQAIREDARRKGTDNLTSQQVDREIAAARRQPAGESIRRSRVRRRAS